jgi:hypothetical protein
MYQSFGTLDSLAKYRLDDLRREAEQERLARLAIGPGRPLRGQLADKLVAIAEWLDRTPRQTVARAG